MNQETTVAEAREIMGSDSDKFSDKEIEKMIRDTDLLADLVLSVVNRVGVKNISKYTIAKVN